MLGAELLPSAALLELAASGAGMLHQQQQLSSSGNRCSDEPCPAVRGIVLGTPLLLDARHGMVTVAVSPSSGLLEVASLARDGTHPRPHLVAHACTVKHHDGIQVTAAGAGTADCLTLASLLAAQHAALLAAAVPIVSAVASAQLAAASSAGGLFGSAASPSDGFTLHPCLLEAALQMQAIAINGSEGQQQHQLLLAPSSVAVYALTGSSTAWGLQEAGVLDIAALTTAPSLGSMYLRSAMTAATAGSGPSQLLSGMGHLLDAKFRPLLGASGWSAPSAHASSATTADVSTVAATSPAAGLQQASLMSRAQLLDLVSSTLAGLLGTAVPTDEPLMAAGLDSLGAIELRNSLQQALGMELPASLAMDQPTPSAIASYLATRLASSDDAQAATMSVPSALRRTLMLTAAGSTRRLMLLYGASPAPWQLQDYDAAGDAIQVVPYTRWDVDRTLPGGAAAELPPRFGCFLPRVGLFDAAAFGISSAEAAAMDPQQRLLLEAALHAIPAGSNVSAGDGVAVYVGVGTADYNTLAHSAGVPVGAYSFTGTSAAATAGRLAYVFNFKVCNTYFGAIAGMEMWQGQCLRWQHHISISSVFM